MKGGLISIIGIDESVSDATLELKSTLHEDRISSCCYTSTSYSPTQCDLATSTEAGYSLIY
jgi:hypothetical protein